MTTSLGKLQIENDKLNKKILILNESLITKNNKIKKLEKKLKDYDKEIEKKIENTVKKLYEKILIENNKLKEENANLKKLLNVTTSINLPTSKTPINEKKYIPNTREKSVNAKGGQTGHKKSKLEAFIDNEITDTHIHEVTRCTCGCTNLVDLGIRITKDNYDIDIRVMKVRNEFHTYMCSNCNKKIDSPVPLNLKEENQYGNNLNALALSLINQGCVSFNRTKSLISGFTFDEVNMSEGYLVKLQKRASNKLESFINDLKVKIINEPVINWDDTCIDIDKQKSCLRVYTTPKLALYTAHLQKGKKGVDEDGILNNLTSKTTLVHDHNVLNYNDEYDFQNAECCIHLIRDLNKLSLDLGHKWSKDLVTLLKKVNVERKQYIEDKLYFENKYIDEVINDYDLIITKGKKQNENDFNKYFGNDEKRILNRLIKYKENYLMWITRFDIPFDNNLAERSLRMSKTKMKVSGQFANINNARYYANIKSYIETCKRNNINEHIAITKLLNNDAYSIDEILEKGL